MSGDRKNRSAEKGSGLNEETVEQVKAGIMYGVGYKNPPEHTRFAKGQSGNPNGRPRAPKNHRLSLEDQPVLRAVLARAEKPVRMREGDKVTEISAREAVIQSVVATALKGNARSQGLALDLMRTADIENARERITRREFARHWKELQSRELAEAKEAGRDSRLILPHPDDIVLDDNDGYHLAGPLVEEELLLIEKQIQVRNALILQYVLDERRRGGTQNDRKRSGQLDGSQSGALLFAMFMNDQLPLRFRLDDSGFMHKERAFQRWTLRQLLKETYAAWRAVGADAKRGVKIPSLDEAVRSLKFVVELHAAFRDERIDLAATARGEFSDEAVELMERHGLGA